MDGSFKNPISFFSNNSFVGKNWNPGESSPRQNKKSITSRVHFFPPDDITDRPIRFLCAELIREKIFRLCGQELPYATTVEIEAFKEEEHLTTIHALIWVEKEGHKRMIIGEKGKKLKEMATSARKDMEKLLNKKVFLKCWCKVKPGWSDNEKFLQQSAMVTNHIEAWLIHKTLIRETSLRLRLMTREEGLIDCSWKSGRTLKKQAPVQPFSLLWLSLSYRYGQCYVNKIETTTPSLQLNGRYLISALYLNELIYYALPLESPHQTLYDEYTFTIKNLTKVQNEIELEVLLRRFEWTLLCTSGYQISLTMEANVQKPIQENLCYRFIPRFGFIEASHGIKGEYILAFSKNKFEDPTVLRAIKGFMRLAIEDLVEGRRIRTRELC